MTSNLTAFLLFALFSFTEQTTAQRDVCPPWFIPDNRSCTGCSCYDSYREVKCNVNVTLLYPGYCMTYNSTNEITEYGPCPYIGHYNTTIILHGFFYVQLPNNVSFLKEFMCGPLNREGPLCGKQGFGIESPELE